MANLDLIKENVELQIQVGRSSNVDILQEEYLISDTLPDVGRILSVDVDKKITKAEVFDGKVLVEADVRFSIIYLSEEEDGSGVNTAVYKNKLSNFIDILGAEQGMLCNVECELEHINSTLVNERKINIEAYFKSVADVYKQEEFNFVKSVDNRNDIQVIKKTEKVDKFIYTGSKRISEKSELEVSMDKGQVEKIIKFDYLVHKKDVRITDDKIRYSCYINVDLMYKSLDSKELNLLNKDIFISDEEDIVGLNSEYNCDYDFKVANADFSVNQNDLGEDRIIVLNFDINTNVKVSKLEEIEVIEDAYSPEKSLNLIKEKAEFKIRLGEGFTEAISKENISVEGDEPVQIISTRGEVVSVDSKISGSNINIDGILKVKCLYKTINADVGYGALDVELPFSACIEIANLTDEMEVCIKSTLESLESAIEAGTIALKGIISFNAKALYKEVKEYIHCIEEDEEEDVEPKKASVVIYVIQCGDTIWKLAKKYKTTMESIATINGIDLEDELMIGTKIIIPGRAII